MKRQLASIIFALSMTTLSFPTFSSDGVISKKSKFTVQETADRLERILSKKGLKIFARIDHTDNAKRIDQELRPTQLIIFGNPKAGTPLMQCSQGAAIDLPQKALIWQDTEGVVWFTYNDPKYIKQRHHVEGCDKVFKKISKALNRLSNAATKQKKKNIHGTYSR